MNYPVLDIKATGERINQLRKDNNLRVTDVAEYMGFESTQAVYKWQRGESLPTVDNLYALSRLLNTSVDDILIGEKERDDDPSISFLLLYFSLFFCLFLDIDGVLNSSKTIDRNFDYPELVMSK